MDDYEDELDRDVDSIIFQIKNQGKSIKNIEKERPELKKEDLEKFIIDNAASVVADSIEMVQGLKTDVLAGGDAKMVEATAELVKAVTGALDALSKLKLSDDKLKGQKELKQMEIDSKISDSPLNGKSGLFISREDLIKNLLNKTEEVVDNNPPIDV
jgi:uncharacterized protein Yka (UPF0111/DUF47 family)